MLVPKSVMTHLCKYLREFYDVAENGKCIGRRKRKASATKYVRSANNYKLVNRIDKKMKDYGFNYMSYLLPLRSFGCFFFASLWIDPSLVASTLKFPAQQKTTTALKEVRGWVFLWAPKKYHGGIL